MIPDTVRAEILCRIKDAELEHGVRVLLAIESGSRAWGFPSPNSDFDVRFIYAHPKEWYLSVGLEEQRDVIEYEITDDIDLNGWDLRKALRLLLKSNPAFVEWMQSPIIYVQSGSFAEGARALLPTVYSCESGVYHYRSMAKSNFRPYLQADLIPLKKYLYVLRPLLAVRWLESYGTAPPIEFQELLHLISENNTLLADIESLLERKRQAPELGREPPVESIHSFIEVELERLEALIAPPHRSAEALVHVNKLFHHVLNETGGNAFRRPGEAT